LTGLSPRAGQTLDLVVPACPLELSIVLEGRAPFECTLLPEPGRTLEIPIALVAPSAR
jgi:hypothetical protein